MHQWNGAVHPLAQGVFTPPCFIIDNLNHVSAFSYSCFVLPWLAIAHLSLHLTLPVCWLINIRDSVFFLHRICSLHQSIFCLSIASDKILILRFPPPPNLSLTFYLFSLFYLQLPFNPSRLHFSQLASPACFVSLCVVIHITYIPWPSVGIHYITYHSQITLILVSI